MGQNQPYNNVELICWVLHNTEVLALMIVRGALSRAAAMAAIKKSEAKSEEDVRVILGWNRVSENSRIARRETSIKIKILIGIARSAYLEAHLAILHRAL